MKKLVAIALVAIMMLSCVTAFATSNTTVETVSDPKHFKQNDAHNGATQSTDIWLRVKAEGQINCTIPLVLIYQTNIDGGEASTGTGADAKYKITNNSTANLAVTDIDVSTVGSKMTLVSNSTDLKSLIDNYWGTITIAGDRVRSGDPYVGDFYTHKTSSEIKAVAGGYFFIPKKTSSGAGVTVIDAKISTSPLDFITAQKADDGTMDITKGLHLVNVKYTVAIDGYASSDDTITTDIEDRVGTNHAFTPIVEAEKGKTAYTYAMSATDGLKINPVQELPTK